MLEGFITFQLSRMHLRDATGGGLRSRGSRLRPPAHGRPSGHSTFNVYRSINRAHASHAPPHDD